MSTQSWVGRRVMVTGASGFVGSWLTRQLVDEGAHVVALIRDMDPQSELLRSGTIDRLSVVNGSLEDYDAVERAVVADECDTIFHLGAQTIVGSARHAPVPTLAANVQGTWHVLEAARRHPGIVRAVVVASSDKAYGTSPVLPYTEEMPLRGDGPYDVSKSCTDLISQSFATTYDVPVAIARCGNIYGGGDLNWSRIVPGTIRSLLQGQQPVLRSDGTFLRDYLHVDDVVTAYLRLADALADPAMAGEAFNFSDESPLTVRAIYDAICLATVGAPVEPMVLGQAQGEIHDQYLDSSKARDALGWTTSVMRDEGLRRTAEWYRQQLAQPD